MPTRELLQRGLNQAVHSSSMFHISALDIHRCVATSGNVVLIIWRRVPRVESIGAIETVVNALATKSKDLVCPLVVVERDIELPPETVRNALSAGLKRFEGQICGMATVLE